jgi:hypothetical protein
MDTLAGSFGQVIDVEPARLGDLVSSMRISPPAYSAVYAIMSECGNAQDWLAK